MNNLPVNLNGLEKQDVYSVATALLYLLKDSPKHSIVSELFYILDYDNFLKLIKYYGGREIRIPSIDEITDLLKVLLVYQYRVVEEIPWREALAKAEVPASESLSMKGKVQQLAVQLDSHDIGKRTYE